MSSNHCAARLCILLAATSAVHAPASAGDKPLRVFDTSHTARGKFSGGGSSQGVMFYLMDNVLTAIPLAVDEATNTLVLARQKLYFKDTGCSSTPYIVPGQAGVRPAVVINVDGQYRGYLARANAIPSYQSFVAEFSFDGSSYKCAPNNGADRIVPITAPVINLTGWLTEPFYLK